MQASLSPVQLLGHSVASIVHHQISGENINKPISDHHCQQDHFHLDLLHSFIWSQNNRHHTLDNNSTIADCNSTIVSKEVVEEESQQSSRLMSGVQVYPYPQRRGIRRPISSSVCNVTISTSWIIKTPVDGLDDDRGGQFRRDIRDLVKEAQPNPSELEFERIRNCVTRLEASGWYYGKLSWQEATGLLRSTPVGTFLVRDSSDPAYLFALSVQTECGPTSIRIHYADGQFKLDAEDLIAGHMPLFDCVVKLVDYYIQMSRTNKLSGTNHVWLDESGRRDRIILINRPLYHRVRSLQHLCRLAVNEHVPLQRISELQLPKALHTFLADYPYSR